MKQSVTKIYAFWAAALFMSACTPEPKAVNEATLQEVEVQGISFHDPLPSSTAEATTTAELEATTTAELLVADEFIAEDEPILDIAAIPSATPVPVENEPAPEESTPEVAEVPPPPAAAPGDFIPLSFETLSGYKYEEPIPNEGEKPEDVEKRRLKDQIPPSIQALNGAKAVVEGWMVPMEVADDGSVRSFVLVNTQPQCCFGDMQAMNEWVDVTMTGGQNAEFNVDMPMKVYGELEVGEKMEDGFVLSIYRMKAQRVEL